MTTLKAIGLEVFKIALFGPSALFNPKTSQALVGGASQAKADESACNATNCRIGNQFEERDFPGTYKVLHWRFSSAGESDTEARPEGLPENTLRIFKHAEGHFVSHEDVSLREFVRNEEKFSSYGNKRQRFELAVVANQSNGIIRSNLEFGEVKREVPVEPPVPPADPRLEKRRVGIFFRKITEETGNFVRKGSGEILKALPEHLPEMKTR